jgi:opacity protein-like surface antigen
MKKLAMAVSMAGVSCVAVAQDQSVKNDGWYVSAGLVQVQSSSGAPEPKNYLLSIGFDFKNNFGIEAQYSGSYKDDSFSIDESFIEDVDDVGFVEYYYDYADVSLNTTALFGTYTFGDKLYGKVKAGFMKAEYTTEVNFDYEVLTGTFDGETGSSSVSFDDSESGWAAGVGAGYQFSANSAVEFEYVTTADKIDINFINIGFKYSF